MAHLIPYIQISVLGRPPTEEEKQWLPSFEEKDDNFWADCEEFNYRQGIVKDLELDISELEE